MTNTRQERRELSSMLNVLWPFLLSCFALTWAYRMVPSVPVRWVAALLGGFVSTILLSVLKIALAWYFTAFPSFKTVYGTLATLPILLLWLNAMWLVILIGAIVVASIEGFQDERIARRWLPVNMGNSSTGKVMSAQELYTIAIALKAELLDPLELTKLAQLKKDRWFESRSLKTLRSLHPTTARIVLDFLSAGQFLQLGRPPGTPFAETLAYTDSLLIRWNTSPNEAGEFQVPDESKQTAALRAYIWNGSMVTKSVAVKDLPATFS
jgi:hypothetical protein